MYLLHALARHVSERPHALAEMDIDFLMKGDDAILRLTEHSIIDHERFPPIALSEIPGQRIVTIGMGGGSDGVQAAMLNSLLENSGKTPVCTISIRTAKTGSVSATGKIGEERTVENHGGEVKGVRNVYKILPETTGSGRFLENIPANQAEMYLIIDTDDGTLTEKIQAVLNAVGGVDTVIGVDTGGDGLYPTTEKGILQAVATPDQDRKSLEAINKLQEVRTLSCEIAADIDTPPNAANILYAANARFHVLTYKENEMVLTQYKLWRMDGTDRSRYGKTSLAWQAALREESGYVCLPLPMDVVLDAKNPWNPFVYITPVTAGMFFMSTKEHLAALNV